jgi:RHS repeat-associated protein
VSVSYPTSVPAGHDGCGLAPSYRALSPYGESLPCETNGNISVSQSPDHCSLITAHWSFTFSAKERDPETGYSYFGSRYYSSDLSIWLSVDPMSDKYPSLSPYVYCANNPVKLVDPNGEEISTHTDKDGNVLAVYNDGILGIFVHTQAEIDDYHNGVKFQNNYDQMIGYSLCVSSFAPGDKIDFGSYQAKQWLNIFEGSFCTSFTNPLHAMAFYASEAGNGGIFDPKSKFSNGSQLSEGIYVSPRDLGNFAAGYFGRSVGLSKETTLASFGAFQLAKNNKKEFIANFHNLYKQALSTQGQGIEPPQKTYGEAAISNYFQRLGYENIRTMSDFEKKYEQIWKD